jgi:alanyl-tRNA synthetase
MDLRTRLYLDDPDLLEFDATIVERRTLADGSVGLVLDHSAFYPTSGGQPHDTGTLDEVAVVDVLEAEDGAVIHRVAASPARDQVHGRIDAERRRDHMQQHSGQHLLSATCVALAERDTLSFHLGTERCSIDLEGPWLDAALFDAIERRTNEIIWEGRPVHVTMQTPEAAHDLRKGVPEGVQSVRVIEIEGWDRNACCGTHVRRTSAIGIVKLLGQERVTSGTRLHFVCGTRALKTAGVAQARLDTLGRLLGCGASELEARCERLLAESRTTRKEIEALQTALSESRATSLVAGAPRPGDVPLVVEALAAGSDAAALRELAAALVARGAVALLGRAAERAEVLFARPEALDLDLRPVLQTACAALGGRGGGPPSRVQGAGPRVEALGSALEAARQQVATQLESPGAP